MKVCLPPKLFCVYTKVNSSHSHNCLHEQHDVAVSFNCFLLMPPIGKWCTFSALTHSFGSPDTFNVQSADIALVEDPAGHCIDTADKTVAAAAVPNVLMSNDEQCPLQTFSLCQFRVR